MINKRWLYISICAFGVGVFIFSDLGLLKWYSLHRERARLKQEIDELILKESQLTQEIEQIKTDDEYLEKIAREKFQMVKPGEKVFRVVDSRKVSD